MKLKLQSSKRAPHQGFHVATVAKIQELEGAKSFEVFLTLTNYEGELSKIFPIAFEQDSSEGKEISTLLGKAITPETEMKEAEGNKVIACIILKRGPGGKHLVPSLAAVLPANEITRAANELVPQLK